MSCRTNPIDLGFLVCYTVLCAYEVYYLYKSEETKYLLIGFPPPLNSGVGHFSLCQLTRSFARSSGYPKILPSNFIIGAQKK
jgi:hypothetical protein